MHQDNLKDLAKNFAKLKAKVKSAQGEVGEVLDKLRDGATLNLYSGSSPFLLPGGSLKKYR